MPKGEKKAGEKVRPKFCLIFIDTLNFRTNTSSALHVG